uniref:Ig-like domain-containing protein n=1 Tax=Poecilia latipinna TaxID=48699 RepID=A0A3B3TLD0_9TELE
RFCCSACFRFFPLNKLSRETIRAEPGENAILPCEAPEKKPVIIVEWRRCDLEGNDHVALYRDEQFDNEGQNPAYKNRVDLQDREIKNGDMSLVLKNVTINDTGTYECRVDGIKNKHRKRSHMKNEPICIITLLVSAPGESDWIRTCSCFMVTNVREKHVRSDVWFSKSDQTNSWFCSAGSNEGQKKDGGNEEGQPENGGTNTGLIVGLSVLAVLALFAVSGFLLYKKLRRSSQEQNQASGGRSVRGP